MYLVSGGFDSLIEPVAKELGIPTKNIFANRLKFFYDGRLQLAPIITPPRCFILLSTRTSSNRVTNATCRSMPAGGYAGFDETEPTSSQTGKAQVISYLKRTNGYRKVVMVGDGATDLAAAPPAVSCGLDVLTFDVINVNHAYAGRVYRVRRQSNS